jgi:hypothetical protein
MRRAALAGPLCGSLSSVVSVFPAKFTTERQRLSEEVVTQLEDYDHIQSIFSGVSSFALSGPGHASRPGESCPNSN